MKKIEVKYISSDQQVSTGIDWNRTIRIMGNAAYVPYKRPRQIDLDDGREEYEAGYRGDY